MTRWLTLAAFIMLLTGTAFAAEKRVALVVGNSTYQFAPRLLNTENDAQDIATALQKVDFDVEILLNADRLQLEAAVRRLGQRSRDAAASVFYYAGHAVEIAGRNWLVPTNSELNNAGDARFEALDLDSILEQMSRSAKVSLVFMDACRDNPFRGRVLASTRDLGVRGLTRIDAVSGALIAFSTAPGTTAEDGNGRNSPFTAAFLHHIDKPGLELRQMLGEVRREVREATNGKQVPWENSALEGQFFFRAALPAPATTGAPAADGDVVFWETIRNSQRASDFGDYLRRFPKGIFADLANKRLNELLASSMFPPRAAVTPATPSPPLAATVPTPPTPSAAAPPALTPSTTPAAAPVVTDFQGNLKALIVAAAPSLSVETGEREARLYDGDGVHQDHRAIAVSANPPGTWRTIRDTTEQAREAALEGCQAYYGSPCALLAVDGTLQTQSRTTVPPLRDMARVRYDGTFDPDQIPAAPLAMRRRPDVLNYASAKGPKASAFAPAGGRLYVETAAPSQRIAEERALESCKNDPGRGGGAAPCFLYSIGARTVLPSRLTAPRAPANTVAEAVAVVATPSVAIGYRADNLHKALAVMPESGRSFRWSNLSSSQQAEQFALEACQLSFGGPCILVASDEELRASDPYLAPPQDVPRIKYAGSYRLDMIPLQTDAAKNKMLADYAKLRGAKAMAIGLGPLRFRVGTARDVVEAERKALAACNDPDPVRPCFLYAVNDKVVLPERRIEAGP